MIIIDRNSVFLDISSDTIAYVKLFFSFLEYSAVVRKYIKVDDWYLWANMDSGKITLPIFQSLEAYWPGVQVCAIMSLV